MFVATESVGVPTPYHGPGRPSHAAHACGGSATACARSTACPSRRRTGRALDELILTVLSQSTNDRNRDVAYLRLRERFPSWEAVRDAPNEEVEEAIRPGGISKVKSQRIQAILRALPTSRSTRLATSVEEPRRSCSRCPASAARPPRACCCSPTASATCRSTPTSRAWARGWACSAPKAPFEEMHDEMLALTPRGQELELHVNLLRHGRRTCHARRPDCDECALSAHVPDRL